MTKYQDPEALEGAYTTRGGEGVPGLLRPSRVNAREDGEKGGSDISHSGLELARLTALGRCNGASLANSKTRHQRQQQQ